MINLSVTQATVGNGGDTLDLTNVVIYRDDNNNGVVDPGEPQMTSIPTLPSGATASVIVRDAVPADIPNNSVANVNLVGTGSPNEATENTDDDNWARANALAQPVLGLTQSPTPASGTDVTPNDTITYTLSGSSTGGSSPDAVDNVVTLDGALTDGILLSEAVPADLTYNAGSLSGSFSYGGTTAGTPVYSTDWWSHLDGNRADRPGSCDQRWAAAALYSRDAPQRERSRPRLTPCASRPRFRQMRLQGIATPRPATSSMIRTATGQRRWRAEQAALRRFWLEGQLPGGEPAALPLHARGTARHGKGAGKTRHSFRGAARRTR